jgi:hypothetical protein
MATEHHKLIAARELALAVVKLATGRPSPAALLIAHDYRATMMTLHEDMLAATLQSPEDVRLIGLALCLIRAAYDADRKGRGNESFVNNYYARLAEAARAATWASSYVARMSPQKQALVIADGHYQIATVADQVVSAVVDRARDDLGIIPPRPEGRQDRRTPASVYSRAVRGPQPIATIVSVRI